MLHHANGPPPLIASFWRILSAAILLSVGLVILPAGSTANEVQFFIYPEQVYRAGETPPSSFGNFTRHITDLHRVHNDIETFSARAEDLERRGPNSQELQRVRAHLRELLEFQRRVRSLMPPDLQPVSVTLHGCAGMAFELGSALAHLRSNPSDWGINQHLWLDGGSWQGGSSRPTSYDRIGRDCDVSSGAPAAPPASSGTPGAPPCNCNDSGVPKYDPSAIGQDWRTRACTSLASTPCNR